MDSAAGNMKVGEKCRWRRFLVLGPAVLIATVCLSKILVVKITLPLLRGGNAMCKANDDVVQTVKWWHVMIKAFTLLL